MSVDVIASLDTEHVEMPDLTPLPPMLVLAATFLVCVD